jgi:hypothetical protein
MITRAILPSLLVLFCCQAPCRAEILTCVGPKGEVYFTDRDCPSGFSLSAAVPATPAAAGKTPFEDERSRNCLYISLMAGDEVNAAIANVERVLVALKKNDDLQLVAAWDACYSQLKERKSAVASAPATEAAQPPSRPENVDRTDPACRQGEFSTEDSVSSYDVYFTNSSDRKCTMVKAYCLCSLSFGAYQQSKDIAVTGNFAPGKKTMIASISPTGPTGGGIDWSWCKFKH